MKAVTVVSVGFGIFSVLFPYDISPRLRTLFTLFKNSLITSTFLRLVFVRVGLALGIGLAIFYVLSGVSLE